MDQDLATPKDGPSYEGVVDGPFLQVEGDIVLQNKSHRVETRGNLPHGDQEQIATLRVQAEVEAQRPYFPRAIVHHPHL